VQSWGLTFFEILDNIFMIFLPPLMKIIKKIRRRLFFFKYKLKTFFNDIKYKILKMLYPDRFVILDKSKDFHFVKTVRPTKKQFESALKEVEKISPELKFQLKY
jgi:hypothetical protein